MGIRKTIILEFDENKRAKLFKQDDMTPMECINLLTAAAAWYYKELYHMASIDKATEALGVGLLQSIARR